jgi:hypothetical protein
MLDFFIVKTTKAIPYAVYGGNVHSFQMTNNPLRFFDGSILKVSKSDGFVYAVFESETDAENWTNEFQGCELSCFDGYMNAYCISH